MPAEGDRSDAGLLRQFLADRDRSCPGCGYNLRSLSAGLCPECGLELELRLALVEPRQAAFVSGLIAIASGAGFNTFLLAFFVYLSMRRGRRFDWDDFWPVVPGAAVCILLLLAWVAGRRRLRRLPAAVRWLLVLLVSGATLTFVALFFVVVR